MKKLIIIVLLQFAYTISMAQTLTLNEIQGIFNAWMNDKGQLSPKITGQLTQFNNQWKLNSDTPTVEDRTKYYSWTAPTEAGPNQIFTLYVEESEDDFKYSVNYLIFHLGKFTNMVGQLRSIYKLKGFAEMVDRNKNTYTVTVMDSKVNYFLTEREVEFTEGEIKTAFTIELVSKYINK